MNTEIIGRPDYGNLALIVVPKIELQPLWSSIIKRGSSMVAYFVDTKASDRKDMICYYEGNIYNACNLTTFKDRALCAYGRMATRYPTTAMCGDTMNSLEIIGRISPTLFEINETEAYLAWTQANQNSKVLT